MITTMIIRRVSVCGWLRFSTHRQNTSLIFCHTLLQTKDMIMVINMDMRKMKICQLGKRKHWRVVMIPWRHRLVEIGKPNPVSARRIRWKNKHREAKEEITKKTKRSIPSFFFWYCFSSSFFPSSRYQSDGWGPNHYPDFYDLTTVLFKKLKRYNS